MIRAQRRESQPAQVAPQAQAPEGGASNAGEQERMVEAQHDTPTHVRVGEGVSGEGVVVNHIPFTPGELAALVDYVGDLTNLSRCDPYTLLQMKALLRSGCEDVALWDRLTHGGYSENSQANEDHFAPGSSGGGANFRDAFLSHYANGLRAAQRAQDFDEDTPEYTAAMDAARLHGYTAEHYLQDAFSAGHQVAAVDVRAAAEAVLESAPAELMMMGIAHQVFAENSEVISQFAFVVPHTGLTNRIDTAAEFILVAEGALLSEGTEGLVDGLRQTVHERLADAGVEVSSPAHPTPWTLRGDHDLDQDEIGTEALHAALSEARSTLELAAIPGTDADALAAQVFTRHCPVPTQDGQTTVERVLTDATRDPFAFMSALVAALSLTIEPVMQQVVRASQGLIVELDKEEEEAPAVEAPAEEAPAEEGPLPAYGPRPAYGPGSASVR